MNNNTRFTPLHSHVVAEIRRRNLLVPGQKLVVAVSGGQDSLCLLKVLRDVQPGWGWAIEVAHLDHRWRPDSAQTACAVGDLAQQWGCPFHLQVATIPPSSEAEARDWRYQWLGEVAQRVGAQAVLTGHTAMDRGETLLLNLLRGTGLAGLGSLDWSRPLVTGVQLVRPLLEITREETETFCAKFQLPVQVDTTNQDFTYLRNRVRLELLPYLAQHFNPQIVRQLAQTADLLGAEEDYLHTLAEQHFQQLYCPDPPRLVRKGLAQLPLALQRRVIHRFLQEQGSQGFRRVEEVRELLDAPQGSRTSSLHQHTGVVVRGESLVWEK